MCLSVAIRTLKITVVACAALKEELCVPVRTQEMQMLFSRTWLESQTAEGDSPV